MMFLFTMDKALYQFFLNFDSVFGWLLSLFLSYHALFIIIGLSFLIESISLLKNISVLFEWMIIILFKSRRI